MFCLRKSHLRWFGVVREFTTRYTEVKIPVPWGHIAAKWWGPLDKRPIVAVHGIQDNSGSFDRIVPKLSTKDLSFLCLDLPGHGWSSWLPKGQFYHEMDTVILLKRLLDYFGWKKMSLLGHSNGGISSFYFTFLFPTCVDFLISFEGYPYNDHKFLENYQKSILNFLKFERAMQKEHKSYSMEQMAVLWNRGSEYSVPIEYAHYLLKRNIKPSESTPNNFVFSTDPRIKCSQLSFWSPECISHYTSKVTMPILCMQGKQSAFIYLQPVLFEMGRKMNGNLETFVGDGTHHAHLTNPEEYAGIVSDFIIKHDEDNSKQGQSGFEKVTVIGDKYGGKVS